MSTIYPIYTQMLSRAEREKKLRQHAKVVWLYGLSGSGKSTLATALEHRLFKNGYVIAHLDGEKDLLEIYVECSFETCRKRDVKGLYQRVDAGLVTDFTGKESTFEPPARPHLVLNTEQTPPEDSLETLYSFVLGHIRFVP